MLRKRLPSVQAQSVLSLLADLHPQAAHGYQMTQSLGIPSGTLYPLLMRLQKAGLLEADWQDGEPGKPPRHVYRLTALGARELGLVAQARASAAAERAVLPPAAGLVA
jgi:PadR family transcriptional regulator, regulatory protein PadR